MINSSYSVRKQKEDRETCLNIPSFLVKQRDNGFHRTFNKYHLMMSLEEIIALTLIKTYFSVPILFRFNEKPK
ncbi:MAG: hypothetical protein ACJATE_001771 [Bacteroidia bacterium]